MTTLPIMSLRIAADYVVGIQTACMALADFPLRGAARPDLGNGIRTIPFQGRAVIAYRPGDDRIRILRVFAFAALVMLKAGTGLAKRET